MTAGNPAALRRRLRVELRKLRRGAGKTQREVADRLDWSPSKIIRIENGAVAVQPTDLRALLEEYGVRDRRVIEELVQMARDSKKQPWSEYKDILSQETLDLFRATASATIYREYDNVVVPGPLQTEEYTRALMAEGFAKPEEVIDRYVEFRQEAHEALLGGDQSPTMFCLLDEGVIRRPIGGPGVMRRQLEHLREVSRNSNVSVRILPFSLGAHFGLRGQFLHLEFGDPDDDDLLYMDNTLVDYISRDDPAMTTEYLQGFWDLEQLALPPVQSAEFLAEVAASFAAQEKGVTDSTPSEE
ncbi:MAG: helix-turn-helix transcriptional regulator [Kineosporiaceae bacterium]